MATFQGKPVDPSLIKGYGGVRTDDPNSIFYGEAIDKNGELNLLGLLPYQLFSSGYFNTDPNVMVKNITNRVNQLSQDAASGKITPEEYDNKINQWNDFISSQQASFKTLQDYNKSRGTSDETLSKTSIPFNDALNKLKSNFYAIGATNDPSSGKLMNYSDLFGGNTSVDNAYGQNNSTNPTAGDSSTTTNPNIVTSASTSKPWMTTPSYKSLISKYSDVSVGSNDASSYIGNFRDQFAANVGRAPTADEYNKFINDVLIPEKPWTKTIDPSTWRQEVQGSLGQLFTGAAEKTAEQKAQDAAAAATAEGSPFDLWSKSYMSSLDTVEKSLADYQSRLFDKIKPNLITSLKAQGLLDTGALNTAFAGTAGDLTSTAENYMAGARTSAAQDIASQKLNLQSFPTSTTYQNISSSVPNLTSSGQTALQNAWLNMSNINLANLNAQNQKNLLEYQYSQQPSELSKWAGTIAGGVATGAAIALL